MSAVAPERPILLGDLMAIEDDFDLDIRIVVNSDEHGPQAGFSNWRSCQGGSCGGSCACGPGSITCTTGSRVC